MILELVFFKIIQYFKILIFIGKIVIKKGGIYDFISLYRLKIRLNIF